MWFEILCTGIIIGFTASIPLGPVGVICIQKTLSKSHKCGIVAGLGAASADLIFAVIASFFLGVVGAFINDNIFYLKLIGGTIIIIVGLRIFLRNTVVQIKKIRLNKGSLWEDFISVFFLTLSNPAFILMFVALFAAFGVPTEELRHIEGGMLVIGVFGGAAIWWTVLTFFISFLRKNFRPRHLLYINKASGALIIGLGVAAIVTLFVKIPLIP
ncbi:MAG: LysE family translocator [Rikenellaceae bacterium]|nr:LysE family translocator [Rikenellaceae bacterium]